MGKGNIGIREKKVQNVGRNIGSKMCCMTGEI